MLFEMADAPEGRLPQKLRELYDGDLGFAKQVTYANFVTSLDGVAALDQDTPPSAISLKSPADRFVMSLLRCFADAVIVGAGTLKAEPHHLWTSEFIYPTLSKEFSELRMTNGLQRTPRLVLLTRSGEIDPSAPALAGDAMVVTTESKASGLRAKLPGSAEVVSTKSDDISLPEVLALVRGYGYSKLLTEGGPTILGQFVGERLLDELFLTLSPALAGRNSHTRRLGLVEGFAFAPTQLALVTLVSVKRAESHLFLRYRFAQEEPNTGNQTPRS